MLSLCTEQMICRQPCGRSHPAQNRRLGVLLDHLVPGSKESRIAAQINDANVLICGHPYVDIWQAVKPEMLGIDAWPDVPHGRAVEGRRHRCLWPAK